MKKKYDVRDKKGRHIRPVFFKYIDGYKGYRKDYHMYIGDEDFYEKLGVVDSFAEVKKFKEKNKDKYNNIVVERGRMSYKRFKTTMDYLEHRINRFRIPYKKMQQPITSILISDDLFDGEYDENAINNIVVKSGIVKKEINSVWNSKNYTNREKRNLAYEKQNELMNYIAEKNISDFTMKKLIEQLETDHKDIKRFLFYLVFKDRNGYMMDSLYRILDMSRHPITVLQEDVDGDIKIYDFRYFEVVAEGEDGEMNYENQDEFAEDVKEFFNDYGLRQDWVAEKLNIPKSTIPDFISGRRKLSKQVYYSLYSFMKKYKSANSWLEI